MKGVLLINLGSPDTTETKDVKRYLGEFLMDERVIDVAYWKRYLLIKGIILQIRPKKSYGYFTIKQCMNRRVCRKPKIDS